MYYFHKNYLKVQRENIKKLSRSYKIKIHVFKNFTKKILDKFWNYVSTEAIVLKFIKLTIRYTKKRHCLNLKQYLLQDESFYLYRGSWRQENNNFEVGISYNVPDKQTRTNSCSEHYKIYGSNKWYTIKTKSRDGSE